MFNDLENYLKKDPAKYQKYQWRVILFHHAHLDDCIDKMIGSQF